MPLRERHLIATVGLLFGLVISSCDASSDNAEKSDAASEPQDIAQADGDEETTQSELTAQYLAGEWCNTHYMAGGERNDEGITYVFNEDGSLLYQTNSRTEVDRPGSYEIDGISLKILPNFMAFNLRVKSLAENELVLTSLGDHHFTRGACS